MGSDRARGEGDPKRSQSLIAPGFLKIIAIWSIIPAYALAGGVLGWLLDTYVFHTFPYLTGAGLLLALVFAVRDVLRLRREWER